MTDHENSVADDGRVRLEAHTLTMLRLRPDAPALSEAEAAALQDAHMAHHAALADAGQLLAYGPPVDQDDPTLRGIAVWSVDPASARRLAEQDPSVAVGRLAVEVATWLLPAGQIGFHPVRVPRAMADVAG